MVIAALMGVILFAAPATDAYAGTRATIKEIESLAVGGRYKLARQKLKALQRKKPKKNLSKVRVFIDQAEREALLRLYYSMKPPEIYYDTGATSSTSSDIPQQLVLLKKILQIRLPQTADDHAKIRGEYEKLVNSDRNIRTRLSRATQKIKAQKYSEALSLLIPVSKYCEYYERPVERMAQIVDTSRNRSLAVMILPVICGVNTAKSSRRALLAKSIKKAELSVDRSPFLILSNQIATYFSIKSKRPVAQVLVSRSIPTDTEAELNTLTTAVRNKGYKISSSKRADLAMLVLVSFERPSITVKRSKPRKINSRYVAGTQKVPNPRYQSNYIAYQMATQNLNTTISQANANRIRMSGNPYYIDLWPIAIGRARQTVNATAQQLAATPQYINEYVYQDYTFTAFEEIYKYTVRWKVTIVLPRYDMTFRNAGRNVKTLQRTGQRGMHEKDSSNSRSAYSAHDEDQKLIQSGMEASANAIAEITNAPFVWKYAGSKNKSRQVRTLKKILVDTYKPVSPFHPPDMVERAAALRFVPVARQRQIIDAMLFESARRQPRKVATLKSTQRSAKTSAVGTIYKRALPSIVTVSTQTGNGSGFFISQNTVVTNFHVTGDASIVRLIFQDKTEILGRVKSFDPNLDLALIEPLGEAAPRALVLARSRPTVGERVLAIGSPLELEGTLTDGLVSAVRETESGVLIQTNAAVNPGNSGGPLLNMRGEVVGVITWKWVGEDLEGLGFAVSVEEVKRLLKNN